MAGLFFWYACLVWIFWGEKRHLPAKVVRRRTSAVGQDRMRGRSRSFGLREAHPERLLFRFFQAKTRACPCFVDSCHVQRLLLTRAQLDFELVPCGTRSPPQIPRQFHSHIATAMCVHYVLTHNPPRRRTTLVGRRHPCIEKVTAPLPCRLSNDRPRPIELIPLLNYRRDTCIFN